MAEPVSPDIVVYVCHNSLPDGGDLPGQWVENDLHVDVQRVPCSGKTDGQYLMHVIEGGGQGFCVATCPVGKCCLAQGNYRAEIRVATTRRLLGEAGFEPERAQFVRCDEDASFEDFDTAIREAVGRISALAKNPIKAA